MVGKKQMLFQAPLFERLVDLDPKATKETPSFRGYDLDGLFYSIAREVTFLLNARPAFSRLQSDVVENELQWTILGYGYLDFTGIFAGASDMWEKMAEVMAEAIMRFEPRIFNVKVEVDNYDEAQHRLFLNVFGDIYVNEVPEHYTFPIIVMNFEEGQATGEMK